MKDIVIVDAVRSAVGRAHKGSLANKRPDELLGASLETRERPCFHHLRGDGLLAGRHCHGDRARDER